MATVKDLKWGLAVSYCFITESIKYFRKQRVFIVSGCIVKMHEDYDDYIEFTDVVSRDEAEKIFQEVMDASIQPLIENSDDDLPF